MIMIVKDLTWFSKQSSEGLHYAQICFDSDGISKSKQKKELEELKKRIIKDLPNKFLFESR